MLDLSVIKNEKLRNLVKSSRKFQALSAFQQQKHLQNMQNATPAQEEKLCNFFTNENSKEASTLNKEEQLEILTRMFNELVELEEKFHKLLKKEPENKQREQDDEDMNNLLTSI